MRLFFALGLLCIAAGCADSILLSSTHTIPTHGAHEVNIPFKDGQLQVWKASTISRGEPDAYVLEFAGIATRAEHIASADALDWIDHRVEIWAVNYPGYGASTGPAKFKEIPDVAITAFDALASHANGRPIFLSGKSMGTAAALFLATQRPAAGLILQNPPPLKDLVLKQYGWWNLWLAAGPIAAGIPPQFDSLQNAKEIVVPAVFFSAKDDGLVPPSFQQDIISAYAGAKRVIYYQGGHHDDPRSTADGAVHQAIDWLWQLAISPVESAHVHLPSGQDRETPQGNRASQFSVLHREPAAD